MGEFWFFWGPLFLDIVMLPICTKLVNFSSIFATSSKIIFAFLTVPVKANLVVCSADPERLAPVLHGAGQHRLVDQVVLLLRQPVHALVVVKLDTQILV